MGYYTRFGLEVIPFSPEVDVAIKEEDNLDYAISDGGQECKWYGYDAEMKQFSTRFPDTLFKLSGEGEESGDIWINYYKNGKAQNCPAIITYDEFDESKLK